MNHETHPNPNELFPLRGKLGGPGRFPAVKAIAALVTTGATVLAVAVVLALSVVCRAVHIMPTTADIEVRLESWDEAPVDWALTQLQAPSEALQTGQLTQRVTLLALEALTPETWYELLFYQQENSQTPVSRFRFRTGPESTPSAPEPTVTQPSATQPPVTEPPAPEPTVTQPSATQPSVTEPPAPKPVPPAAEAPVLEHYAAPPADTYFDPIPGESGYTVSFRFRLNDGLPTRIVVRDTTTEYSNFSTYYGNQGSTETSQNPVTRIYALSDIQIDPITNTAAVTYFTDDPFLGHALSATLEYTLSGSAGAVSTSVLTLEPSYLYGMEVGSGNTWNAVIRGDSLEVTLGIRDFHSGSLDYRLSLLEISLYYISEDGDYAYYDLSQLIDPPSLPQAESGTLTYRFTVPLKPAGWDSPPLSIELSMYAQGDCQLSGQPMNLPSETFGYTTVYTVDTYRVETPAIRFSPDFLTELLEQLSMRLESIDMYTDRGSWGDHLDAVIPSDTVYVSLYFSGEAPIDCLLIPHITFSGDLVLDYSPEIHISQGDYGFSFSFQFLMPQRDVLRGDLVIEDFDITLMPSGNTY